MILRMVCGYALDIEKRIDNDKNRTIICHGHRADAGSLKASKRTYAL